MTGEIVFDCYNIENYHSDEDMRLFNSTYPCPIENRLKRHKLLLIKKADYPGQKPYFAIKGRLFFEIYLDVLKYYPLCLSRYLKGGDLHGEI